MTNVAAHLGLAVFALGALLASGCSSRQERAGAAELKARPVAAAPVPRAPLSSAALADLRADEVGRIPILMYHSIGAKTTYRGLRYDKEGLNISTATFRKQLDAMYAAHWYPVNAHDVLTAHLDVPAGKTPVVLSFDDARGTQFHYLKDGTIDPDCAVGILEAFHKKHADWPERATFYVLPQSAWNPVPFWQPGKERKKLEYLVAHGYEIGNHTTTHHLMTHMTAKTIMWELAECDKYIKARAPGATMDTMALPGGAAPKDHSLWKDIMDGEFNGTKYHNRCIMMAWGGPTESWVAKKFDAQRVMRIGVSPGYMEGWMKRMRRGGSIRAYISDGDPNTIAVPRSQKQYVNLSRLQGARLVVYDDAPKQKPKQRTVASVKGI